MQHIALDIGEVIFHVNLMPFYDELNKHGINYEYSARFLEFYEQPLNVGLYTLEQCMDFHFGTFKMDAARHSILKAWDKCLTPNTGMFNFIENLKDNGVKIALLSNIGYEHATYLRTHYSELLNGCIQHFSFEVGAAKPHMLYFQSFLLNNEDFAGSLFLDDRKENVIAAAKQKFDALQFCISDMEKPSDLKKFLDDINGRMKRGW